jgi:hypothetical protein
MVDIAAVAATLSPLAALAARGRSWSLVVARGRLRATAGERVTFLQHLLFAYDVTGIAESQRVLSEMLSIRPFGISY